MTIVEQLKLSEINLGVFAQSPEKVQFKLTTRGGGAKIKM